MSNSISHTSSRMLPTSGRGRKGEGINPITPECRLAQHCTRALRSPSTGTDTAVPGHRAPSARVHRASARTRTFPAEVRVSGVSRLPKVWPSGARIRARQVHRLPQRTDGGVFLQTPGVLPQLWRTPHGRYSRTSGGSGAARDSYSPWVLPFPFPIPDACSKIS